jgi:hemoglobin
MNLGPPIWSRVDMSTETKKPSLYERLGGIYAIAAVVDTFIDRIMVSPELNANPLVDEAHHRVPKAGFKYLVTEMVGQVTGGPQRYTGKSMAESHKHLNISPSEWVVFAGIFKAVLDEYKVPEAEQAELFAIVGTTRGDIVVENPVAAKAS